MRIIYTILLAIVANVSIAETQTILLTTHSQTSTVTVTGYANPFVGEIDEIAVYTPSGVTGSVAVAAIDPYSSSALVLATNAVTGYAVWRPRIMETSLTGDAVLVVTNAAGADRFNARGESIRAILSDASKTSSVFRVVVKTK